MHGLQQRSRHAAALLRSGQRAGIQALPLRLQRAQSSCCKAVRCGPVLSADARKSSMPGRPGMRGITVLRLRLPCHRLCTHHVRGLACFECLTS